MYTLKIIPRTLHFKQPAGTSRGVYHTGRYGICYLPTLKPDNMA